MAAQNPSTSKPLITEEARSIKLALITKVKRPRVRIFTGKVKIINKGLSVTFISPKNKDSQRADQKLTIVTPGII